MGGKRISQGKKGGRNHLTSDSTFWCCRSHWGSEHGCFHKSRGVIATHTALVHLSVRSDGKLYDKVIKISVKVSTKLKGSPWHFCPLSGLFRSLLSRSVHLHPDIVVNCRLCRTVIGLNFQP